MKLLKLNKECNSKVTENRKLNVKVRYLEKELKHRETMIQELMQRPLQYPAYSSPVTQTRQALEALQKSYENNLVINLKKLIHDLKGEMKLKEEKIEQLQQDTRGTLLREVKAERNAFESEAKRLRSILDNFINQIGGVDQILNFRGYLDQQQEYIKQLEEQKETQQQIYESKYEECLKLEKKLLETEMERESAKKATVDKQKQYDKKQIELDNQIIEYRLLEKKKKESEDDYKTQIKALEKVLSTRKAEIEDLTHTVKTRDATIKSRDSDIKNLQKEIKDLKLELENRDGIIAEREYTIEERDTRIAELETQLEDTIKKFEKKIEGMIKDRQQAEDGFKQNIDDLENEIVDMVNQKKKLIEDHAKEIKQHEEKERGYESDIEELQDKLKNMQLEKERLTQTLEQTKAKHKQEKEDYEQEIR